MRNKLLNRKQMYFQNGICRRVRRKTNCGTYSWALGYGNPRVTPNITALQCFALRPRRNTSSAVRMQSVLHDKPCCPGDTLQRVGDFNSSALKCSCPNRETARNGGVRWERKTFSIISHVIQAYVGARIKAGTSFYAHESSFPPTVFNKMRRADIPVRLSVRGLIVFRITWSDARRILPTAR